METSVSINIAAGHENPKSGVSHVFPHAWEIALSSPNLLGHNCVISYPAKRAATPLFRNSQRKGPVPFQNPDPDKVRRELQA
jgi:hypothetical protein